LLDNERLLVSHALNIGLRRARGDVIVLVGGHTEIAPDYLRRCVDLLSSEQVDAVGGPIETIGETSCAQSIAAAMSSSFGVGGCAFRTVTDRTMLVDTAAFAAYTRAIVNRTGTFDEELVRNQDDEFNYRLRKRGGKILLSPQVRSRYYSRGTIGKLWSQYFQYGYWKVRVAQKHPLQMKLRHFIPAAFVLCVLGSALLAPFHPAAFIAFGMVVTLYAAANLAATLRVCRTTTWKNLPRLPLIFAVLHFSYGLGFLVGLIRFMHRWRSPN
jgi:GT2 family glycosyltransferase